MFLQYTSMNYFMEDMAKDGDDHKEASHPFPHHNI
jgi:hypothetical protein